MDDSIWLINAFFFPDFPFSTTNVLAVLAAGSAPIRNGLFFPFQFYNWKCDGSGMADLETLGLYYFLYCILGTPSRPLSGIITLPTL